MSNKVNRIRTLFFLLLTNILGCNADPAPITFRVINQLSVPAYHYGMTLSQDGQLIMMTLPCEYLECDALSGGVCGQTKPSPPAELEAGSQTDFHWDGFTWVISEHIRYGITQPCMQRKRPKGTMTWSLSYGLSFQSIERQFNAGISAYETDYPLVDVNTVTDTFVYGAELRALKLH